MGKKGQKRKTTEHKRRLGAQGPTAGHRGRCFAFLPVRPQVTRFAQLLETASRATPQPAPRHPLLSLSHLDRRDLVTHLRRLAPLHRRGGPPQAPHSGRTARDVPAGRGVVPCAYSVGLRPPRRPRQRVMPFACLVRGPCAPSTSEAPVAARRPCSRPSRRAEARRRRYVLAA